MIIIKSKKELEIMREAGKIVAGAHELVAKSIEVGMTTAQLNRLVEEYIYRHNAIPSFKGYHGFPASICTSINHQVIHGIPGPVQLQDGDIVSVDIGVMYKGYHGDAAKTYAIGNVHPRALQLIKAVEEAFYEGLKYARPGYRLSDISHAIQTFVEGKGYSVVKAFVGHGIGQNMHEDPQVPNYGPPGKGVRLRPGMTLAIEPMINEGTDQVVILDDGWTVVTQDGSLSAHYEHTIAITDGDPEILTQ
ncbi:type I methionyl aminopeptidase [Caldicoprobacter algeriensis]|uniref:type I methionyl aminopeptidase n=1 Tax=Caldicoprobacter algeriensis TaxID=699281 RepID=UPI0020798988|nr:type I methionyl aminopeptidase [Caldicoprobacter algeriensis]MCM8900366.1 type I methionyl aminopeptidase [Caldicoprobacter algeriensis]